MKKFKQLFSFLALTLMIGLLAMNVGIVKAEDITHDPITPGSMITGEEDIDSFDSYDVTVSPKGGSLIVPIEMKYNGVLKITVVGTDIPDRVTTTLYKDAECTNSISGGFLSLSTKYPDDNIKVEIPTKGTYYLKFTSGNYTEADSSLTITPYAFSSADKTLKNKEWVGSHSVSNPIAHKITITSPGYIAVEGYTLTKDYINVTLLNSKKEKLSDQIYVNKSSNFTTYFAVKKGTYYLSAKAGSQDYKLSYTFSPVTENSGSSKSKAVSIGKGKTVKGTVFIEDSKDKADWYKVKLTKAQKLSFDIYAKGTGSIQFDIIPENSKTILFGSNFRIYDTDGGTYASEDKMSAGTYYIKVTRYTDVTSGSYSIKLN